MSINPAGGHEGRRAMNENRQAQTLRALADYMRGKREGGPNPPVGISTRPRTKRSHSEGQKWIFGP